jgi:hypothetical protein
MEEAVYSMDSERGILCLLSLEAVLSCLSAAPFWCLEEGGSGFLCCSGEEEAWRRRCISCAWEKKKKGLLGGGVSTFCLHILLEVLFYWGRLFEGKKKPVSFLVGRGGRRWRRRWRLAAALFNRR